MPKQKPPRQTPGAGLSHLILYATIAEGSQRVDEGQAQGLPLPDFVTIGEGVAYSHREGRHKACPYISVSPPGN